MCEVINRIQKFKNHEQLLLLLSRKVVLDDYKEYCQNLIDDPAFNWEEFLGLAYNNRLNGVIYNRIIQFRHIPRETLLCLQLSFQAQKEREKIHQKEIYEIFKQFENENLSYAFLKGAVINTLLYEHGERISNDTDIMVDEKDLQKCSEILERMGYIQGSLDKKTNKIIPATNREKIFARINTYEVSPFIKETEKSFLNFHSVDVNFKLSNNEDSSNSKRMLENATVVSNSNGSIRTFAKEHFFIFICIHLYREAVMMSQILIGKDLMTYKFLDIHFWVLSIEMDWDIIYNNAKEINKLKEVYYTMYFTEILYPKTINEDVLKKFKVDDCSYLNEYMGKENSDERYKWNLTFEERVFSRSRIVEAFKNLKEEDTRYEKIKTALKE